MTVTPLITLRAELLTDGNNHKINVGTFVTDGLDQSLRQAATDALIDTLHNMEVNLTAIGRSASGQGSPGTN